MFVAPRKVFLRRIHRGVGGGGGGGVFMASRVEGLSLLGFACALLRGDVGWLSENSKLGKPHNIISSVQL